MKKYIATAILGVLTISCNKQHNLAMKSSDKDFILNMANDFYEQKKWSKAISLYDRLPNMVAGTADATEVVFKSAYANYYDKNYKLAGHQFRNFATTFVRDERREEAAYMSAICYYQDSAEYNLDQASTETAINQLQDFLAQYPNSERVKDVNEKIEELSQKLEFKYYEHARQYFRMADYKAAVAEFENLLNDYPSTKLKDKSLDFIMKSKYELAMHSIFDLKKDRLENAIAFSRDLEKNSNDESSVKNALGMRDKLTKELEKHLERIAEVEAKKAEFLERQREREKEEK